MALRELVGWAGGGFAGGRAHWGGSLVALRGWLRAPLPHPGRFQFRSPGGLAAALGGSLVPLRYVDDDGRPTGEYPLNPNGSGGAAAALCSPCGRHLAVMPHPERGVRGWQWPWWPPGWGGRGAAAPWLRMFQNACEWCLRWPHGQP